MAQHVLMCMRGMFKASHMSPTYLEQLRVHNQVKLKGPYPKYKYGLGLIKLPL